MQAISVLMRSGRNWASGRKYSRACRNLFRRQKPCDSMDGAVFEMLLIPAILHDDVHIDDNLSDRE